MNGMGPWFYVDRANTVVCCQKEGINAGVSAVVRHFAAQDINRVILSNMEDGGYASLCGESTRWWFPVSLMPGWSSPPHTSAWPAGGAQRTALIPPS